MDATEKQKVEARFEISTMNEFLAKAKPRPRPLFGDMWLTGELAVMFAEAGCGKSVLAVQIAESIARGAAIKPLDTKPRRQKVVYLDLESAPDQFSSRYRRDEGKFKPYEFSRNLIFIRPLDVGEACVAMVEDLIETTGAKVLIIDNLAHLMEGHSSNETARVMRELRRLCRRDGVSILLLVHSPPALLRRGIEARDLPFGHVISAYADNVFAVGRVGAAASERYIKHLRPGAAAHVFGAAHVPWFRIRKRANFTFFEFQGFGREGVLRLSDGDRREWQLIDRIAELKGLGMSVRAIASTLEMSKSTVQRYMLLCREETQPVPTPTNPPQATDDPLFLPLDDEAEYDLYDAEAGGESEFDIEQLLSGPDTANGEAPEYEFNTGASEMENSSDDDPSEPLSEDNFEKVLGGIEQPSDAQRKPLLERDVDTYGREIWIEKRCESGRPLVWYQAIINNGAPIGKYTRWEHRGLAGNIGSIVDSLPSDNSGRSPP